MRLLRGKETNARCLAIIAILLSIYGPVNAAPAPEDTAAAAAVEQNGNAGSVATQTPATTATSALQQQEVHTTVSLQPTVAPQKQTQDLVLPSVVPEHPAQVDPQQPVASGPSTDPLDAAPGKQNIVSSVVPEKPVKPPVVPAHPVAPEVPPQHPTDASGKGADKPATTAETPADKPVTHADKDKEKTAKSDEKATDDHKDKGTSEDPADGNIHPAQVPTVGANGSKPDGAEGDSAHHKPSADDNGKLPVVETGSHATNGTHADGAGNATLPTVEAGVGKDTGKDAQKEEGDVVNKGSEGEGKGTEKGKDKEADTDGENGADNEHSDGENSSNSADGNTNNNSGGAENKDQPSDNDHSDGGDQGDQDDDDGTKDADPKKSGGSTEEDPKEDGSKEHGSTNDGQNDDGSGDDNGDQKDNSDGSHDGSGSGDPPKDKQDGDTTGTAKPVPKDNVPTTGTAQPIPQNAPPKPDPAEDPATVDPIPPSPPSVAPVEKESRPKDTEPNQGTNNNSNNSNNDNGGNKNGSNENEHGSFSAASVPDEPTGADQPGTSDSPSDGDGGNGGMSRGKKKKQRTVQMVQLPSGEKKQVAVTTGGKLAEALPAGTTMVGVPYVADDESDDPYGQTNYGLIIGGAVGIALAVAAAGFFVVNRVRLAKRASQENQSTAKDNGGDLERQDQDDHYDNDDDEKKPLSPSADDPWSAYMTRLDQSANTQQSGGKYGAVPDLESLDSMSDAEDFKPASLVVAKEEQQQKQHRCLSNTASAPVLPADTLSCVSSMTASSISGVSSAPFSETSQSIATVTPRRLAVNDRTSMRTFVTISSDATGSVLFPDDSVSVVGHRLPSATIQKPPSAALRKSAVFSPSSLRSHR